jgi:peptide deformylase
MPEPSPADIMRSLGITQEGAPILTWPARPFSLPAEADEALDVTDLLDSVLDQAAAVHDFTKGSGIAAPQLGIPRAAMMIRSPAGNAWTLLNPRVTWRYPAEDEQYEGCLSFFDVRGLVPRPLGVEVTYSDLDGTTRTIVLKEAAARLACHEIDHLDGILYRQRMRPGTTPIPVAEYREAGRPWTY